MLIAINIKTNWSATGNGCAKNICVRTMNEDRNTLLSFVCD